MSTLAAMRNGAPRATRSSCTRTEFGSVALIKRYPVEATISGLAQIILDEAAARKAPTPATTLLLLGVPEQSVIMGWLG